jgi:hypothetical protein
MNASSKSTVINISNPLARRLEEFARVAGVTPERMVNDILGAEFGPNRDLQSGGLETFRKYICYHLSGGSSPFGGGDGRFPKAQADKLAARYNAFAKAEAERTGQVQTNEAKVESCKDGSFCLYFPTIRSAEVRRAIRANDWLLSPRRRVAA